MIHFYRASAINIYICIYIYVDTRTNPSVGKTINQETKRPRDSLTTSSVRLSLFCNSMVTVTKGQRPVFSFFPFESKLESQRTHCTTKYTLHHAATHCDTLHTLQHTATHYSTLQHTPCQKYALQHTVAHCSTLQHTAAHCNTLQHTAAHCSTLRHTATHCKIRLAKSIFR